LCGVRETGTFIESMAGNERVRAFVPFPLPPSNPALDPLVLSGPLVENATLALGRLDAMAAFLPQTWLFIYMFVRKEAVLSSQIEGTQSTLSDLLAAEIGRVPGALAEDVQEVSRYVSALDHGLSRIRSGFPLCNRLLREMHSILLSEGRGQHASPGEFRTTQNWIGGTRPGNAIHVPPPPQELQDCMSQFEAFMNLEATSTSHLVHVALLHLQFEMIHPFLDGNGRLGRLLIPLSLVSRGVLREPLLYLSLYFRQHRQTYYRLLQEVRVSGTWEAWIEFFLQGVIETAGSAVTASQSVLKLFETDHSRLRELGRKGQTALRIHEALQQRPVCTVAQLASQLGLSHVAIGRGVELLTGEGILEESTGKQRGRIFVYKPYLSILSGELEKTSISN
jgi:Fic family protein